MFRGGPHDGVPRHHGHLPRAAAAGPLRVAHGHHQEAEGGAPVRTLAIQGNNFIFVQPNLGPPNFFMEIPQGPLDMSQNTF